MIHRDKLGKIKKFSATEIFREVNFSAFRSSKLAILSISNALTYNFRTIEAIFPELKNRAIIIVKMHRGLPTTEIKK